MRDSLGGTPITMYRILLFLALIVPGPLRLAHAQDVHSDSQTRQDTTFVTPRDVTPPAVQQCPKLTGLSRHGTVLVETIVDTLGHAEPKATKVIKSPDDSLSTLALRVTLDCQFTPARYRSHAVRALARVPVNF